MAAASVTATAAGPVDFEAKIQPLLEEHCVDCHAADEPDGDFALHTFEALMKGGKGGAAVVPGNSQDSLLVKFLEGRSGKEGKNQFMPPGKREHFTAEQIAVVRQWIDAGAMAPSGPTRVPDALAALPKIQPRSVPKRAVRSLAFSDKTSLIAQGSYGSIQLLDGKDGRKLVRTLDGIAGKVNSLAFSPDGRLLFAAAGDAGVNGVAYQWNVADGTLLRKFEGHTDALYALALSPDAKWLATGSYDQKVRLWDAATGTELRVLSGHNGAVYSLSFRPDGKILASASADRTVKLWEVTTGKRLDTFSQPLKEQTAVSFSPDGATLVAGGADKRIRLWNISASGVEGSNKLLATRFAHEGALLTLAFSRDGKMLYSTAADASAKIWQGQTLAELHLIEKQPDWAPALTRLDGDKILLGRLDGSLGVYSGSTGKPEVPPVAAPAKKLVLAKPELLRVEPRGLQSGASTRVKFIGKSLGGLQLVKMSHPGIRAKIVSVNPAGTMAEVDLVAESAVPRSQVDCSLVTPGGETVKQKLLVDDLPQLIVPEDGVSLRLDRMPMNVWGTISRAGQVDACAFAAKKGEAVVFDLAVARVDSKMISSRLEVVDSSGTLLASSNGLDSGSDPFIAFQVPEDGEYKVLVREVTLGSSPDHFYRLTAGVLPYITGWWPLSAPAGRDVEVHLVGHNLAQDSVTVTAGAAGMVELPSDAKDYRSRVNMRVEASELPEILEQEPNDESGKLLQTLSFPSSVNGRLLGSTEGVKSDVDHFRIEMEKGQQAVIETRAAVMGSPADTKVDVLDEKGQPVPMMRMQATKDSWITLRSEDANDSAIRLGQFSEMDLNDHMYFNGEVLKIYRLARGPDADMIFFAQGGKRRAYFNTSPAGHGLDDACYVVEPRPLDAQIISNGLPVFTLNYANDDDGDRKLGRDSRLVFTAPAKGGYILRVSDTRGWGGDRFSYRLIVRPSAPDFSATLRLPSKVSLPSGSGIQFAFAADRVDGFEGEIQMEINGLPEGLFASSPVTIEAGHLEAGGTLFARPGLKGGQPDFSKVTVTATAVIGGETITKSISAFPPVTVTATPKRTLYIEPDLAGKPAGDGKTPPVVPYEIIIEPGSTVPAWLRVHRNGDDALIGVDVENLPHGVIVDNIGLNGVQIRAGESEREIFLACASWVPEQERLCHMVVGSARNDAVKADAAQTSFPVLLKVRKSAKAVAVEPSSGR